LVSCFSRLAKDIPLLRNWVLRRNAHVSKMRSPETSDIKLSKVHEASSDYASVVEVYTCNDPLSEENTNFVNQLFRPYF